MRCEQCGSEQFSTHLPAVRDYISGETFAIRRCTSCNLCVTDPMPEESEIGRYYPQRYRTDRQKYSGGLRTKLRAAALLRQFPAGFRGRILDVGCGTGAFAMEMKSRGWQVAVTEINDAVLDRMRAEGMEAKRPGDALRDGFAEKFDAITAWHVLEHIHHPLELSKWAHDQLKSDGVFQVTVPNLASWQARMFDADWLHLDVPRHLYHFTPGTLARLLLTAKFEIAHSTSFAFEYDLFGWLQSALNRVCTRPNVLFEKITAAGASTTHLPKRDVLLSYAVAPLMMTWIVPMSAASALVGRGGTLTVTARPTDIALIAPAA